MKAEKRVTDQHRSHTSTDWSEPGVGAPWQHRVFFWLIRVGGHRFAHMLGSCVALWYVLFRPTIRRRTRHYLDRRFPDRCRFLQRLTDSHRLAREFAASLIDQATVGFFGKERFHTEIEGYDELCNLLAENKGLVLLNAHVGSWQMSLSVLDKLQTPVRIVMIPEGTARPDHEAEAKPAPFRVIDPRKGLDSVMEMMQALQNREIVGLMGDRSFGSASGSIDVEFMGDIATFSLAPYRLASATGAPIAFLLAFKTKPGHYLIKLARVIRVPAGLGRDSAAYRTHALEFAAALEEFTEDYPFQYFNFFDLWSKRQDQEQVHG